MRKIAAYAIIATLFTATFMYTGCASTRRDAILKQLDAVSGATKKTMNQ
jgi:hypothetical protein